MTVRDVDAIEHYAARAGFEYVVCSAPVAYREDLDAGNRAMLDKIAARPRLLGSPVISPTHIEASVRWLDRCARDPKLGHVTWDPDNEGEAYGSERYMALWEEVAKRDVPVFWNAGSQDLERNVRWEKKLGYMPMIRGGSRAEIEMFLEVGRRHPDLQVIIGHGMGEDGVTVAGQNRNFYLEHSGSYPERGALRNPCQSPVTRSALSPLSRNPCGPAQALRRPRGSSPAPPAASSIPRPLAPSSPRP